jgi:hypothetical protein
MDINVYGGGRSSMHPREGALIREKRRGIDGRGVKEGYYRALMGRIEEGGVRGTRAMAGGGAAVVSWPRWEEEDGADARAPSVSGWKREEALVGRRGETGPRVGRRWSGPAGLGWGLLFFFQIHFNPISNLFRFKSFTSFQIPILTQISPTILKAFHKPFLTTFRHILNSNLYTNFHKLFHNFFKDFFTNILRLLKSHHNQNSCIQIMMHKHLLLLNY